MQMNLDGRSTAWTGRVRRAQAGACCHVDAQIRPGQGMKDRAVGGNNKTGAHE